MTARLEPRTLSGRATAMSARSDAHVAAGSVRPSRRTVKT